MDGAYETFEKIRQSLEKFHLVLRLGGQCVQFCLCGANSMFDMDVKLPKLGEGADSGTVVTVFVKEGDSIRKDQPILELENEKAVASVPSTADGIVSKLFVKPGDKLSVGQRILSVSGGAAGATDATRSNRMDGEISNVVVQSNPEEHDREDEPDVADDGEGGRKPETSQASGTVPAAAPTIRKLALDLGIDLARVRGSERGGRIVMADLKRYIQDLQSRGRGEKSAPPSEIPSEPVSNRIDFSKWGPISAKPLSSLRQVISRRMTENWTTIPHVTQYDEADISALLELRKKYAPAFKENGTRLTLTSFALKAVCGALRAHPIFNASLDESSNQIVFKDYYHIGIAVDTDAGLLVPVIRNVDQKSILDLSKELESLAAKARDRKVSLDDLQGGTFTISNQGGIGGAQFTPIVNKPEVAILGLGRGLLKPVVKDSQIVQRTMLPIAVSYDHRVIDGGTAARFVVGLVEAFESFRDKDLA